MAASRLAADDNDVVRCFSGEPGGGGSSGGYQMLCLEIVGQAFLWHQVRCIVAVLLLVGQGLEEPEVGLHTTRGWLTHLLLSAANRNCL